MNARSEGKDTMNNEQLAELVDLAIRRLAHVAGQVPDEDRRAFWEQIGAHCTYQQARLLLGFNKDTIEPRLVYPDPVCSK